MNGQLAVDLVRQAVMLSLGGGLAGVALGMLISFVLSHAFPLPTKVTPGLVVVGLLLSVVTGFFAGYFPARKAANLTPIEALRYE